MMGYKEGAGEEAGVGAREEAGLGARELFFTFLFFFFFFFFIDELFAFFFFIFFFDELSAFFFFIFFEGGVIDLWNGFDPLLDLLLLYFPELVLDFEDFAFKEVFLSFTTFFFASS